MPSPVHPYSDYGVALRTLRASRGWLGLLLFVCVVAQFIGFALMWWTVQPYDHLKPRWEWTSISEALNSPPPSSHPANATAAATSGPKAEALPVFPESVESKRLDVHKQWHTAYTMLVPLTQITALIAVSSQFIIIFVTLLVVLIAQAPGVAQITRGLIWSVLALFMFFPWQYFAPDFPIPGIIYKYDELLRDIGPGVMGEVKYAYQTWSVYGRYIVWPLVGLFVLLITSERYRAGVMIAIGHPLQSILQPRNAGAGGPSAPSLANPKPRSLIPLPGNGGQTGKRIV